MSNPSNWNASFDKLLERSLARVASLEEKNVRITWYSEISAGTSGVITCPTGGRIALDQWSAGIDAVTSTITTGQTPDLVSAKTVGDTIITATLDASGNWTISDTPAAYPIAIIYVYEINLKDI